MSVSEAVSALAAGGMVVVADDLDRENEGDIIADAAAVTEQQIAFIVRHTTGIVCAPMPEADAARLALPMMVADNEEPHRTAFTVSVDHAGTGTGVSAGDRAMTLNALASSNTVPSDLRRPGHIFPLVAREGGVLRRAGHTEAAVDLLRLAGPSRVGVIAECINGRGDMLRGAELRAFARRHGLPFVTIAELVSHRRATESMVERVAESTLPTVAGDFRVTVFRSKSDGVEHLAMTMGDLVRRSQAADGPLVRVHSECLTGDVLGSLRCDCGYQLDGALRLIAEEGCGVVVYLRGHEGRGIGLGHKIRAYSLQEQGYDTVDANRQLGLPVDSRSYGVGAEILSLLGVERLRLITNNPAKYGGLEGYGLTITARVPSLVAPNVHNINYLRAKRNRMGHKLDDLQIEAPEGVVIEERRRGAGRPTTNGEPDRPPERGHQRKAT